MQFKIIEILKKLIEMHSKYKPKSKFVENKTNSKHIEIEF